MTSVSASNTDPDEEQEPSYMSTSELRRGPGWWMDLEGQWNPPEEWPESSPPLPGWIRMADGSWAAPTRRSTDPDADPDKPVTGAPKPATIHDFTSAIQDRPIPDIGPSTVPSLNSIAGPDAIAPKRITPTASTDASTGSSVNLSFSSSTANPVVLDQDRLQRRARSAALVAAITAAMLAAGLILLLLLL